MFADLPMGGAIGCRVVEPDCQFEPRMLVVIPMNIYVHNADVIIGTGVADAAEDTLDDVDVMFSAIQVHADR